MIYIYFLSFHLCLSLISLARILFSFGLLKCYSFGCIDFYQFFFPFSILLISAFILIVSFFLFNRIWSSVIKYLYRQDCHVFFIIIKSLSMPGSCPCPEVYIFMLVLIVFTWYNFPSSWFNLYVFILKVSSL